MGNRHFTAVRGFAAALALVVATPAICPVLRVGPLELDPLENWVLTFDAGIDASDVLLGLSTAGIPAWPDGLDSGDPTLGVVQVEGTLDAAFAAASVGSSSLHGSPLTGGSGSAPSMSDSGTPGTTGGNHDGMSIAAVGAGGSIPRGPAHSPTSPSPGLVAPPGSDATPPPAGITEGRDAGYFGPGRDLAPPVQVALVPPITGSPPLGTVGMPWQFPVIATGPSVIVKEGDIPVPGNPLFDVETNAGNDGLPGPPVFTDNWVPPYPNDVPTDIKPTDFTPMGFTPLDDVRLTVTINAVPEPGTLALLALGLVGIALARRKRKRMPR